MYRLLDPPQTDDSVEDVDGRPLLLAFFQSLVSSMVSWPSSSLEATNLKETYLDISLTVYSLILGSLQHLDEILTEPAARSSDSKADKRRRLRRLAVKDTIWYLCSVLHILIATQTNDGQHLAPSNPSLVAGATRPKVSQLHDLREAILKYFLTFLGHSSGAEVTSTSSENSDASGTAPVNPTAETAKLSQTPTRIVFDDMEHQMLLRVAESYFTLL
ncbi:hypothetical protein CVT26_010768 [Gymnopilus dilepis]|uniref:Uncharacterized protein n=1 Tax=Gymnopilus dilepis TaxID=231916 RepID=A0A409W5A4_9AGAR|nr:hypothetical protein CVT26_010768 [Gymnopilus dilepis]